MRVALSTTSRKRLLSGPLMKAASWGREGGHVATSAHGMLYPWTMRPLDDPSGILYPLDFVSLGWCVSWMMRPLGNASLTDGLCYIGTDWPFVAIGKVELLRRSRAYIAHMGESFWVILGGCRPPNITQNNLSWQVPDAVRDFSFGDTLFGDTSSWRPTSQADRFAKLLSWERNGIFLAKIFAAVNWCICGKSALPTYLSHSAKKKDDKENSSTSSLYF